jgi:hypothetical protein
VKSHLLIFAMIAGLASPAAEQDDGFKSIFDGQSLAGWETPDLSYWTVEEGAITGRITIDHPCTINQYLVWKGGELADFEMKLKSRLQGEGGINNGFQFRSRLLPDHDICGYQVDNNLQTPWLVRLYDEFGRHTLAMRGERTVFDSRGMRSTSNIEEATGPAWFRLEDWHEYHLICIGPKIILRVDGKPAAEVEDLDVRRQELQGIFALQLHSGPPTLVQFKDVRLKILKPAAKPQAPPFSESSRHRTDLLEQASAWWALDSGGHGAKPILRHIPGWERFELNVKSEGPGARPGAKVVLMDGAYFEAGPIPGFGEKELTLFLRARDARGDWNAALISMGKAPDTVAFAMFGKDLPETAGPDLAFEVRTSAGLARISFPWSDEHKTSWHDLVARYDGRELVLFCDGRLMARKSQQGALLKSDAPLLIAAELGDGKIERHFHGELEEAAVWSRALSDEEFKAISGR